MWLGVSHLQVQQFSVRSHSFPENCLSWAAERQKGRELLLTHSHTLTHTHTYTHKHSERREEERERRRGDREDCRKENSLLVSLALQLLTRSVLFYSSSTSAAAAAVCFACHVAGLCVWCISFSCHFFIRADDSSDHLRHCARCQSAGYRLGPLTAVAGRATISFQCKFLNCQTYDQRSWTASWLYSSATSYEVLNVFFVCAHKLTLELINSRSIMLAGTNMWTETATSNSVSASHWKKVCCSSFVHIIGELGVQLCETLLFVDV